MCTNLMTELEEMICELSLRIDNGEYSSEIRQRVSFLEGQLYNLKFFIIDKDNESEYKKRVEALKKDAKKLKDEIDAYDDRNPDLDLQLSVAKQKEISKLFTTNTKRNNHKERE